MTNQSSHIEETPWPKSGDKAIVETHPLKGASIVGDKKERDWRIRRGYREGADILIQHAIDNNRRALNLIYPIMFCYRHSLEVELKYIIESYGHFINQEPDFRNHGLKTLWKKCRPIIEEFNSGADSTPLDVMESVITELDEFDGNSFSFRYATDTKGLKIDLSKKSFDLINLRNVLSGIYTLLECVDCQISTIESEYCSSENYA